ncbi:SAM-dependent methyltransferase [Fischerella thermalis CCMEE 5201]|jgi:tRNA (cmo5U34)-methyltransferase|nr:SAM-dependent methyltransferase [Fischerella thermalis CCMEE 5201]
MNQTIDFDTNPTVAVSEYDNMARMALPGYEAMHTMVLACLRSHLPEKANLLIVGAGTGMELVRFAKSNREWQMLGVDPSANMLAVAQEKIQQHHLSEQVQLFQGYTHDLPATTLYNAATSILVMHFIPDDGGKLAFLQSIAQRLQSSAVFILVDVFGETNTREFEQTISFVKKYWAEMGIPPQKMAQLLERINDGVHLIGEARELELLQQAGFSNVMRFYTGLWVGGWVAIKN